MVDVGCRLRGRSGKRFTCKVVKNRKRTYMACPLSAGWRLLKVAPMWRRGGARLRRGRGDADVARSLTELEIYGILSRAISHTLVVFQVVFDTWKWVDRTPADHKRT